MPGSGAHSKTFTTFAQIAEAWLADVAQHRRPGTVALYEIALVKFYEAVPEALSQ
jgi:hypothetical protein